MFTIGQTLSAADRIALPIGASFGTPFETRGQYLRAAADGERMFAHFSTPEDVRYRNEDFGDGIAWTLRTLPEEAPRYGFRDDVTVTGFDGPQFGIHDREGNRFARFGTTGADQSWENPERARGYLTRILDGSFDPEALFWQAATDITVPGADTPAAPAARVELSAVERFGREKMLIANMVWEHVRRAGNEHYYGTLVAAGLLPDRHAVQDFRATLANDSELSDWLRELAEAANEGDMCEVYDQMCREVGLPDREDLGVPREREFRVTGYATVTVRVPVSTYVTAGNESDAIDQADGAVDREDILEAVRYQGYEVEDTEWEEAEVS